MDLMYRLIKEAHAARLQMVENRFSGKLSLQKLSCAVERQRYASAIDAKSDTIGRPMV